ncbi:hypothetical protein [Streptomyces sp. IB2014 016-6]|uniref:hypothetical protein n=1 Tax=Streptomyces sp. IB2014 016-6 TaxID=2517818 RepID=UPI0011CA5932|nr:hypothetical protein [Streptomyces sp. IB2014 016-6]TXL88291.1 hypothetical protein EW053_19470 [Streptomyces sp. IB2014 016-6]
MVISSTADVGEDDPVDRGGPPAGPAASPGNRRARRRFVSRDERRFGSDVVGPRVRRVRPPPFGPTAGAPVIEYAAWHWIFLVNVPI